MSFVLLDIYQFQNEENNKHAHTLTKLKNFKSRVSTLLLTFFSLYSIYIFNPLILDYRTKLIYIFCSAFTDDQLMKVKVPLEFILIIINSLLGKGKSSILIIIVINVDLIRSYFLSFSPSLSLSLSLSTFPLFPRHLN